jgi:hypothetical protein
MSEPAETLDTDALDPLPTLQPGEKHFALLGRDQLSPPFLRLYAAVIEGRYDRAQGIFNSIITAGMTRMPRPHKDKQHAASARKLADEMEMWRLATLRPLQTPQRINTAPERDPEAFQPGPTHSELKAARPPAEPEEST